MKLSSSLVGKLVKATAGRNKKSNEEVVYGTVKYIDNETYILLDGSIDPTPAHTTVTVSDGDRVSGVLKNHVVLITGNATDNSASESDVKKNRTSINRLNDSITLQIVNTSGETTAEIKMEDYKIKLTGDVIADSLSVAALFAKDINVTGSFEVDNGKMRLLTANDGISLSTYNKEYAEDPLYNPASILLAENRIFIGRSGKNGPTIDIVGKIDLTGDVFIGGNVYRLNSDGQAISALPDIYASSWTPTVSGAGSYSVQQGQCIRIGDTAIVSFAVYGVFAGNTTERIKISGCPMTPADNISSGGGHLSGYTAASNIVFTGWNTNINGSFYAVGQETNVTGANKFGTTAIYQKASGDFSASGTLVYKISG